MRRAALCLCFALAATGEARAWELDTHVGLTQRAVMVGDSATDVTLARAASIPVIGVDFGYTPVPMAELKPDRLISHFDALPSACGRRLTACGAKSEPL